MDTKHKPYKIVVLSDLKEATDSTLNSAIQLATIINGDIDLFHVKKPIEVIESSNQLSAVRTINKDYIVTDNTIKKLIKKTDNTLKTSLQHHIAIGNIQQEISNYITEKKPDIIVLGKRKSKLFGLIGDHITDFILNTYKGVVMIASDKNTFEPNHEVSLGVLKNDHLSTTMNFYEDLLKNTKKTVTTFSGGRMPKNNDLNTKSTKNRTSFLGENTDILNNVAKSDVNLFCIDRSDNNYSLKELNGFIKKLSCTVILSGS
mgnify:CR=1 FL=1